MGGTDPSISTTTIISEYDTIIVNLIIKGGKGGFGAALRRAAKQAGPKKTTDFGACRDLSGRRIRHVNDEIILRKWQEAKDRGEEFNVDEETQSGIKLWFLPTPSWTEGFGKKPKNAKRKAKRKTELCKDWARAHEPGRFVPPKAPSWWGCPRGHRCDFAHGEVDMNKDVRTTVQERKKQEERQKDRDALQQYLDPMYGDGNGDGDEDEDLVMTGLKRVSKRARHIAATTIHTHEENVELHEEEEVAVDDMVNNNVIPIPLVEPSPPTTVSQCSWLSLLTGDALVLPSGEVQGQEEFSTVQAVDSLLYGPGSWYYELELLTGGLMQVGWACTGFEPSALGGDGVGDHPRSWAYDGFRVLRWNVHPVQYGELESVESVSGNSSSSKNDNTMEEEEEENNQEEVDEKGEEEEALSLLRKHQWQSGDIIGCSLQLSEHSGHTLVRMVFSRNGQSLGDAFYFDLKESLQLSDSKNSGGDDGTIGFFPALSVDTNQSVKVNFGHEPFKYGSPISQDAKSIYSSSSSSKSIVVGEVEVSKTQSPPNVNQQQQILMVQTPIALESSQYPTWAALIPLGSDSLKQELTRRGLKCGGTLEERAKRLFSVRGLSDDEINTKLKVRTSV